MAASQGACLGAQQLSQPVPEPCSSAPLNHARPVWCLPPVQTSSYLHVGEATVLLPGAQSETEGTDTGTQWMGCIVARNALMQGAVVRTLDGVASQEACCRACRGLGAGCNGGWRLQRAPGASAGRLEGGGLGVSPLLARCAAVGPAGAVWRRVCAGVWVMGNEPKLAA